jgi:hypothetical protein
MTALTMRPTGLGHGVYKDSIVAHEFTQVVVCALLP